jgi:glycosyltransferase involved in cell wall biosynthesis
MRPGGAEMRLLDLMSRLSPPEFFVDVCALSGLAGSLDAAVHACGGRVIPLRLDAHFPVRFLRLLREGRYDVVHSHVRYTSGAILALAALADRPVRIAHIHNTDDGRRRTLRRQFQQLVLRHLIDRYATHIIGCGESAMNAAWQAGWRSDPRCQVIYDAIDLDRFQVPHEREGVRAELDVPIDEPLFIHIGNERVGEQKNHRRLLAIFAAIQRRLRSSWLALVGNGNDHPDGDTAQAMHQLCIPGRVLRLGVRHDVPRLLKAADMLLLPSRWEGLPGAVLEASAAGIPVLASDLPGVREIAQRLPAVRYLPLTASDDVWAMAALDSLNEASKLRLPESAAATFRASVFHLDRAAEAHRALWSSW